MVAVGVLSPPPPPEKGPLPVLAVVGVSTSESESEMPLLSADWPLRRWRCLLLWPVARLLGLPLAFLTLLSEERTFGAVENLLGVFLEEPVRPAVTLRMALMPEVLLLDGGIASEGAGNGTEGALMESGAVAGICMDIWDDVFMLMTSLLLTSSYVAEGMLAVIDGEREACERAAPRLLGSPFSRLRII